MELHNWRIEYFYKYGFKFQILCVDYAQECIKKYLKPINRKSNPLRSLKITCIIRAVQQRDFDPQKIPIELSDHIFRIQCKKTIHPVRVLRSNLYTLKQGKFVKTLHRCDYRCFKWRSNKTRAQNLQHLKKWRKNMLSRTVEFRWHYEIRSACEFKGYVEPIICHIGDELDKRLARLLTGYVRDSHLSYWNLRHCPYVD
jgi:hypothetical protein